MNADIEHCSMSTHDAVAAMMAISSPGVAGVNLLFNRQHLNPLSSLSWHMFSFESVRTCQ